MVGVSSAEATSREADRAVVNAVCAVEGAGLAESEAERERERAEPGEERKRKEEEERESAGGSQGCISVYGDRCRRYTPGRIQLF